MSPFAIRYCSQELTKDLTKDNWVGAEVSYTQKRDSLIDLFIKDTPQQTWFLRNNGWFGELQNQGPYPMTITYADAANYWPPGSAWGKDRKPALKRTTNRLYYPFTITPLAPPITITVNNRDSIIIRQECSINPTNTEHDYKSTCRLVVYKLPDTIDVGEGYDCLQGVKFGTIIATTEPVTRVITLTTEQEQLVFHHRQNNKLKS